MGNAISPLSGNILKTAAVSWYVKVSKPQILLIRDHIRNKINSHSRGRHRGLVRHAIFQEALDSAGVRADPDQDIFNLLFTMWDTKGSMRVTSAELIVGLSILACRYDGVEDAIRFALEVSDIHGSQTISSHDATALLRSICATASYFGDQLLHLRQIYKLVDNIFDTITLISQEAADLTHGEFVERLMKEPLVTELVATGPRRGKAVSFALSNMSNNSIASDRTTSTSSSSSSQDKCGDSQPALIESTNSGASSETGSSGNSAESSSTDDDENKKDMPSQHRASPAVTESIVDPANPSMLLSQFSDCDTSSLHPLKPITKISIYTEDENA